MVQVGAGDHHHPAGRGRGVHPGPVGEALGVLTGDDPPQVDLGRLLGPGDEDAAAGHGHHLGHLEARRGDGQAVDGEAAGVAGRVVGGHDQPAVQPRRHAADEVDPGRVALGGQGGGRPGAGVGGQDQGGRLVTGLDQQGEGAAGLPQDRRQVRVGGPVPADLDPPALQVDHVQAHLGVGGAGGRVGEPDRLDRRVGRVGQVEPPHLGQVDPGNRQPLSVRGPPEPPRPPHLLGGHELGQSPAHLRVVLAGQPPPGAGVAQGGDMEGAVGHPGDPGAGRVDPRVEHRLARRQLPHPAGPVQGGHEQPAGQGEAGHRQVEVGGEGDDAAGALPGPFPPGPLLGRHVAGVAAEQAGRVGDQPLGPGGQLQHPQPVDRVVPGGRAQERHPGAVGAHLEPARPPEGEPPGAGVPPGEGRRVARAAVGPPDRSVSQDRRPGRWPRRPGPRPAR